MTESAPQAHDWTGLRRIRRAVVVVDMVESVRLIEADETGTVQRWRGIVATAVLGIAAPLGGRLVKSLGDGLMLEFPAPREAAGAGLRILDHVARNNASLRDEQRIELRIGIHVADVLADELDLYGAGVNLAARLCALAGPGEIVVSAEVRDALADGIDADLEDLGDCHLRHVAAPVHTFRLGPPGPRPVMLGQLSPRDSLIPTIAVLPFTQRGHDAEALVLGELVSDALTTLLSRSGELRVISRLSAHALKDRALDAAATGRLLGARYVVTGTAQLVGGRIVLHVELSDAPAGSLVWADRTIGPLDALLSDDADFVGRLGDGTLRALKVNEVRRALLHPLATLESATLMVAAITLMHRATRGDFLRVRAMLEHLIDRHRRNPIPRAWLAKWHVLSVTRGLAQAQADNTREAMEQTRRALDVDPECALALTVEGFVQCHMLKDLDAARLRYDLALEADPNESLGWLFKGVLHSFRNEPGAAVAAAERALALTPLDPMLYYYRSLAASAILPSGDYPRVIELAQASLRSNRGHSSTYRVLAIAQALDGRVDDARATIRDLDRIEPGFTVRQFLQRSPSARTEMGPICADALRAAGVPEH